MTKCRFFVLGDYPRMASIHVMSGKQQQLVPAGNEKTSGEKLAEQIFQAEKNGSEICQWDSMARYMGHLAVSGENEVWFDCNHFWKIKIVVNCEKMRKVH